MDVSVSGGKLWKKALRPYARGDGMAVQVGIFESATYSGETAPAGTPVAAVAAAHEFGTEKIPARSFMRSTVIKKQTEWIKDAVAYLQARPGDLRGAFTAVGEMASKDMQEAIAWGIDPPLNSRTIARKRARGKEEPDTPLIDTGTMQEAITYEVFER